MMREIILDSFLEHQQAMKVTTAQLNIGAAINIKARKVYNTMGDNTGNAAIITASLGCFIRRE